MHQCDGTYFSPQMLIVQTWQPPQGKYQSPFDYIIDPVANKATEVWRSRQVEGYSTRNRAYNPVVPYNTQKFHYLPVMGKFDFSRLSQTDVCDVTSSQRPFAPNFGTVSLADTIAPLFNQMGAMYDPTTDEDLGTCTLIAHNLVLVARHSIEGRDIRNVKAKFGYTAFEGTFQSAGSAKFEKVIEEDASSDYAIIQLKQPIGEQLGFVPLSTEGSLLTEPALLHYPLGKPLKVSVHTFVQSQYESARLVAYHDSDYLSSGGAYFDPSGRMVAIHLGSELEGGTMNLHRYALPLERIVRQNPYSLLGRFASGELSQASSYTSGFPLHYLPRTDHQYLIDEEGRESEKILRGLLAKEIKKDKKIKLTGSKTISFTQANLAYIQNRYPKKYDSFVEQCLGKTGLHGVTSLYSVKGVIESDHTIPHNVWKSTKNPKMKEFVKGGGKRQGQNGMPAITIPWAIHRPLLTTGGVSGYLDFHKSLIKLCDQDRIDDALILCYQEYEAKGLDMQAYQGEIESSLDDHIKLGLITKAQKAKIKKAVF